MGTIFVARSASLSDWASDVGQSKHVYKVGYTEAPVKEVVAAGWAGLADWTLVKKQDGVEGMDEEAVVERLAAKERMLDPAIYPRLKGTRGVFKVPPAHVENHITVTRALAGTSESGPLKLKPADFAAYLIHNALRAPAGGSAGA